METSLVTTILTGIISLFSGAGFWSWYKAREDKKKTPYDMFMELMAEQKRFYEARNADYEREKLDSAEKSSVIMKSHSASTSTPTRTSSAPLTLPTTNASRRGATGADTGVTTSRSATANSK